MSQLISVKRSHSVAILNCKLLFSFRSTADINFEHTFVNVEQRMSLFKALRYNGTTKKLSERETSRFRLQLPKELNSKDKLDKHTITVYLGFNGHYNEPPLKFGHTICAGAQDLEVLDNEVFYVVTFDPISKEWKSQDVLEDDVEENVSVVVITSVCFAFVFVPRISTLSRLN